MSESTDYGHPIKAMGCSQCLSLSVVHRKGKHCQKPHYRNEVVCRYVWAIPLSHIEYLLEYFSYEKN